MNILPSISKGLSKGEIVDIISKHTDQDLFEKDGCTWIGWVGLKFNRDGKLESVSPTWSYGEPDPCYPNDSK